ncbi:MAG: alpha/beta fold hydrolase, partial [Gemmatimonadales bacterium]
MEVPEIRYAPCGDLSIAYQRFGSGPDLVGLPPFAQNIEVMWEDARYRRLLERLSAHATLTHFDKRGTGLSDRSIGAPTLEERMDDFRAVMDHADIERASIVAGSEAGPMAMLFAATHPSRVDKLALFGTFCASTWAIDPALEYQREIVDAWIEALAAGWGTPQSISVASFMPSLLDDPAYLRWAQRYERACLTPKSVRDLMRLNVAIDVREALPLIQAPTLVFHRSGDRVIPLQQGRYVADHIAGARF